jgi:putative ABC transport system permease protein
VRLGRSLALSLRALLAHRLRVLLAVSSVTIGVAAVLLTSAIGQGARAEVLRTIDGMGTNLLVVRPAEVKRQAARRAMSGVVTTLAVDDYHAIADLGLVASAAPGLEAPLRVKAEGLAMVTKVLGTTPSFPDVRRFRLRDGRFFDGNDDRDARRVAVLGDRVQKSLFPGDDAVGQVIRIRGVPFEVIGVFEAKGAVAYGSDEDNQVVVPIRTALRRIFNSTWLTSVFVSVADAGRMEEGEDEIRRLLRERHRAAAEGRPDDFAIQNQAKVLSLQRETAESLTLLGTGLAAVALLMGGTGILALMLLSVKERTGEIGLRMAVGARPRDVLSQFLIEASLLALGGWLVGVTLGGLGVGVVAYGTEWNIGVPGEAIVASLIMAVVTGLGFGALPARKASRLPPIQSLGAG